MKLKPITGYDSIYSIREDGMVRAHDRLTKAGHLHKAKWLKSCPNRKGGYLHVKLQTPTGRKTAYIHRLVAEAFMPNPYNLPQVNHIDGNKYNNHVSNLEWCTQEENNLHAQKLGLVGKQPPVSLRNKFLLDNL